MHPTLAAFAERYRHAFSDLVITEHGDELRIEWQEAPTAPCYTATMRIQDGQVAFRCIAGWHGAGDGDLLDAAVYVMDAAEGFWRDRPAILAAPGTFGALVLERRLLRDSAIRPNSPDRLT